MQFLQSLKLLPHQLDAHVSAYVEAVYASAELDERGERLKAQLIADYHHRITEAVLDALPAASRQCALDWVACGRLEMVDLLLRAHRSFVVAVVQQQSARFVAQYAVVAVFEDVLV